MLSDDNHYVPSAIRQSLADVIIEWAKVEAMMAEFLSYLLNADAGAMYVLNQDVSSATQLKWIRALAADKFTDPNTQANLKILFDRIDVARVERNGYVHGVWSEGNSEDLDSTAFVQTVKLDRVEMVRSELVTRADLNDLFREVQSIRIELDTLADKLGFVKKRR
jgi:hypothetical protein